MVICGKPAVTWFVASTNQRHSGLCKYIGPIGDLSLTTATYSRRLGIDRQCTHSLHRKDMAYCHFELCRDCGLGLLNSESLLADIRRLSVVAVVFLYKITVFFTTKHNSITFGTLF